MAFGLENLIFFDSAKLADGAVYWADVIRSCDWTSSALEWTGEKIIEARVAGRIGVGSFRHIDAVTLDEPLDHGRGRAPALGAGQLAQELREQFFRQQILREDG